MLAKMATYRTATAAQRVSWGRLGRVGSGLQMWPSMHQASAAFEARVRKVLHRKNPGHRPCRFLCRTWQSQIPITARTKIGSLLAPRFPPSRLVRRLPSALGSIATVNGRELASCKPKLLESFKLMCKLCNHPARPPPNPVRPLSVGGFSCKYSVRPYRTNTKCKNITGHKILFPLLSQPCLPHSTHKHPPQARASRSLLTRYG